MAKQLQRKIGLLSGELTDEASQLNQSSVSYSQYGTEFDTEETSASNYIHTEEKLLKLQQDLKVPVKIILATLNYDIADEQLSLAVDDETRPLTD